MRKKVISFFLATLVLLGIAGTVSAIELRASHNLQSYHVGLSAKGNGQMLITYDVNGVREQVKIGVQSIDIDYKKSADSEWAYYDTLFASTHPEFYAYNTSMHEGEIYFDGVPGAIYRVTIVAYAKDKDSSDTGYVTSPGITCK